MVHSKSNSGFLYFLGEHCGMEIAVLLLLTVPLTSASPLRPALSLDKDVSITVDTVEASGLEKSEEAQEQHIPFLKIVPFRPRDQHLDMDAIKRSLAGRLLRQRRAPQPGCKFGTCHVQNLGNTLYHISKTSGKEKSKNTHDPQGYGR
ncbi:uncharacterized protein LOC144037963 [Vanacampus margaritifer]